MNRYQTSFCSQTVCVRVLAIASLSSSGQERFRRLMPQFCRNAAVAIVMCDVTQPKSLQSTRIWKKQVDENVVQPNGQPIPSVLLINKVLISVLIIILLSLQYVHVYTCRGISDMLYKHDELCAEHYKSSYTSI